MHLYYIYIKYRNLYIHTEIYTYKYIHISIWIYRHLTWGPSLIMLYVLCMVTFAHERVSENYWHAYKCRQITFTQLIHINNQKEQQHTELYEHISRSRIVSITCIPKICKNKRQQHKYNMCLCRDTHIDIDMYACIFI